MTLFNFREVTTTTTTVIVITVIIILIIIIIIIISLISYSFPPVNGLSRYLLLLIL